MSMAGPICPSRSWRVGNAPNSNSHCGESGMDGLDLTTSLLTIGIAVLSGLLSGLSGFGAGLMLSAFLVPLAGAKPTVALLAVAMVITNLGRIHAFGHRPDLPRAAFV